MASMTSFLIVTCALLLSSADAQSPGTGSIPASLMDLIQQMTQASPSSPSSSSAPASPQVSLVESFGPIASSTLHSGTQQAVDPFSSPQSSATSSQTSGSQTPSSSSSSSSSSSGQGTGGNVAKFFGGGSSSAWGSSSTSSNSVSVGGGSTPTSEPLGNDIISKVQAYVNRASSYSPPTGSMNMSPPPTSSSGMGPMPPPPLTSSSGIGGLMPGPSDMGHLPSMHTGPSMMGPDPLGPMSGMMPPMSPLGSMLPGAMMNPMQSQAMLRMGRRLGQKFGVNEYYQIHGCEDPTQLFSGRQKVMATLAMAQGCQSFRAMHICRMAQVKERIGNSLLTSRVLPPHVRARLESCLSAKVLFSSMQPPPPPPLSMGILPALSAAGAPSLRECGMLLSTVMDGGSLDPESMISTRRRMLPWSCNESNMGPNNIPYRVCCPGKVMEPTLQEAHMVRRMINA